LHYLQSFRAADQKHSGNRAALTLLLHASMDAAEFDRLVERARDPRLIPGIYNYCDGRCRRCPFTQRCLTFLDSQEVTAAVGSEQSLADTIGDSLRRTVEMLAEAARRERVDLAASPAEETQPSGDDLVRHRQDPLASQGREYAQLAWRIGRAIAPIAAARADVSLVESVATIEWFSSLISSKLYRAICGQAEGWEDADAVQTDFNGSAKMALIGISESQRAWAVLMEVGRATANGVPAQAVRMLAELDAAVRARFPRVMEFVRPGFDQVGIDEGGVR
jgi:hypothetical protein